VSVERSAVGSTIENADRGASSSKFGLCPVGRLETLVEADCHGSCTDTLPDFCISTISSRDGW